MRLNFRYSIRLMVIIGLFTAGGIASGDVLYTNDFESGIGAEWSQVVLDSSVPDPFTTFSGRFGNSTQTLTVSNLTVSEQYSLFFDLYIIDSWDGGADKFNVDLGSSNVFSHSFHYNATSQTYPDPPDLGPAQYGFNGSYLDSIYRNIEIVFSASSNAVPFSFYGTGLQSLSDESWGIDNIRVQTMSTTTIAGTSLPTDIATVPVEWFTVTAIRNLSADAANNAASYELIGAGVDGSFDTSDDAVYTLLPSYSGGKTVTLTIGNNVPLQPGNYRFSTTSSLLDSVDAPVELYAQIFSITGPIEGLDNGSLISADNLSLQESPSDSGFFTATGYGTFSSSTDDDYWTFYAEPGDRITAFVQVSRSDVNPYISLRNASGTQLSTPNNWTDFTRLQDYVIPSAGTYYLQLDPYYDRQPPASYTLRLDLARGRFLETEDNNIIGQADGLSWDVDGLALKNKIAGALEKNADYYNLGHLSSGNAMSVNVRFPDGSSLNAANVNFEVQTADGAVLYAANTPVFNYDVATNAVLYLKVDSSVYGTLAQYVVDFLVLDSGLPDIASDTLPAEGSTNSVIIDRFSVNFQEYMDVASVTDPASWQLVSSGADAIFGNGDDEVYTLVPSYSVNTLSASFAISDGPLQPDRNYRFTATTNITDRVGNPIASTYIREFRLENIPLFTHENRSNGNMTLATPLGAVGSVADGSVSHMQTIGVGDNPLDVIAGDLNGDLQPDLITCNFNSDSLTILFGNEMGSFTVATNVAAGDGPRQAVLGHFNGDAVLDLAVANEYADSIMVYLGQGDGTFLPPTTLAAADAPYDIKAGDLDGDTFTDLAVIHYNSSTLRIYKGDGAGNFVTLTNIPTGTNPEEVSLAFLNGDAHLDIAVANLSSDNVSVYLNNGDGTFAAPVSYPVGDGPRCIKAGDVNSDGNQDLIVGNYYADNIAILMGIGDGTFAAVTNYAGCNGPVDVELLDLNDDGFPEIATASHDGYRLNFFNNQGDGTFAFSSHEFTINYYPYSIAVGDFTGDMIDDLAVVNPYYDQVYTYGANAEIILPEDPDGSGLRFGQGRGNITSSSDYDYWGFSGEAGDKIVMAIEMPGNPGSSGLRYRLVSSTGADLGSYSANSSGYGQSPPITLPETGRYAMMVYYNYSYWQEYRVRVSKVPASGQMESEDNNSIGAADLLSFDVSSNGLAASVAGYIGTAVDGVGDYYSLGNLTSGTVVNVTLAMPDSSELIPEVDMIDPAGQPAAFTSNLVLRLGGTATDYAVVNPITNFPTTAFTAEFWMRSSDTSKEGTPISYARSGQYNELILFDYRSFDPYLGGSSYNSGIAANNGRWTHVAWTWDSVTGTSLIYRNGELVHSNANFRTAYNMVQGGAFVVGQEQDVLAGNFQTSQSFLGDIDEIALWNAVRSQAEIQNDLASGLAGSESGLVGYWDFEDGTANDLTSQGNDLSLFGNSLIVASDIVSDPGNPSSYPTTFQYTTTNSGIYYVRVRDALVQGDLMRQYVLDISLQDGVPPSITQLTLPTEGTNSMAVVDRFSMSFSEEMDADSVNSSASYELRSAGLDGLLDTADDEIYTVLPTYISGLQASYIVSDGPLQPGAVRFTALTGLLDRSGNPMTANYVRTFSIAAPDDFTLESRDNGSSATATSLGSVIPGEESGSLIGNGSVGVGVNPYAVAQEDFNGDGHDDLATANLSSDHVSILLGDGEGGFVVSTNITVGDGPVGLEVGLLDGDDNLDLAVVNYYADTVSILLGDGTGAFMWATNQYVGDAPRDISIADMNNDGAMDLAICNEYADSVSILLGNGDGSFAAAVTQPSNAFHRVENPLCFVLQDKQLLKMGI